MADDEFPSDEHGDTWPTARVSQLVADPERIGRFEIRRRLGSGGMGVVYAGRDRELSRTVAIKLLLDEHAAAGRSDRLRREAQVMARLSHPNVVPVFEVGEHEGAVFVVMEYVRGGTLGEWIEDEHPTWEETLEAFVDAGRGIAAAHGAGVVHRDFKPDNVLRGRDGRVMVVDFGLARSVALRDGAGQVSSLGARAASIAPTLTGNGTRIGTPAYMSPEQIRGERGDARGDQFSFAVALWEALYGEHPFGAKVWPGLAMAVVGGELHRPAHPGDVPPGVQKVLERALAPNPDDRWPTFAEMLEALRRAAWPVARRRVVAGTVAVAGLGAALWLGYAMGRTETLAGCDGASSLSQVWTDEVRDGLRGRFADDLPHVAKTWEMAERQIDQWRGQWDRLHAATCSELTQLSNEALALRQRRVACLDAAVDSLAVVAEVASQLSSVELANAGTELATGLDDLSWCASDVAVGLRPEVPQAQRDPVRTARAQLRRERLLRQAGDSEGADAALAAAKDQVAQLASPVPALGAELSVAQARTVAEPDARRDALQRALLDAEASGHDAVAVVVLLDLAEAAADDHDARSADWYLGRVDAALRRVGSPVGLGRVAREHRVTVLAALGRHDEAIRLQRAVVDQLRQRDDGSLALPAARLRLVELEVAAAEDVPDDALDRVSDVVAAYERILGAEHPAVTDPLAVRAELHAKLARRDDADSREHTAAGLDDDVRIIDIVRRTHGEAGHPNLAGALHRQAFRQFDTGESYELGLSWSYEAVQVGTKTLGEADRRTQGYRYYATRIRHALGATEHMDELLDALCLHHEVNRGPTSVDAFGMRAVARMKAGDETGAAQDLRAAWTQAQWLYDQGRLDGHALWAEWASEVAEAGGDSEAALAFAEAALLWWGLADPTRADRNAARTWGRVRTRVGRHRVAHGALAAARPPLRATLDEAAETRSAHASSVRPYLPRAAYALAQVELAAGNLDRARALALRARKGFANLGNAPARQEVDTWLTSLPTTVATAEPDAAAAP